MNFPVFDLHCDTVLELLGADFNQPGSLRKNTFHIDLERAKKLPGYCQCFACYTSPMQEQKRKISSVLAFERELVSLQREFDANRDLIELVYEPGDIERNREKGKMH